MITLCKIILRYTDSVWSKGCIARIVKHTLIVIWSRNFELCTMTYWWDIFPFAPKLVTSAMVKMLDEKSVPLPKNNLTHDGDPS